MSFSEFQQKKEVNNMVKPVSTNLNWAKARIAEIENSICDLYKGINKIIVQGEYADDDELHSLYTQRKICLDMLMTSIH